MICVAPDVGGVERTRALSRRINSSIAIIDKRRPAPGKSEVMNIVGNVKNNTSNGVMSDPPPTPVNPTRVPTTKPEMIYSKIMINELKKI